MQRMLDPRRGMHRHTWLTKIFRIIFCHFIADTEQLGRIIHCTVHRSHKQLMLPFSQSRILIFIIKIVIIHAENIQWNISGLCNLQGNIIDKRIITGGQKTQSGAKSSNHFLNFLVFQCESFHHVFLAR